MMSFQRSKGWKQGKFWWIHESLYLEIIFFQLFVEVLLFGDDVCEILSQVGELQELGSLGKVLLQFVMIGI